jgi:hypothetical protein
MLATALGQEFSVTFANERFAESGNDVAKGVGDLVKWIRQRDKNARFGILEKKEANETIVDFLLLPSGNDKSVGFHVLRYAAATDGQGACCRPLSLALRSRRI